MNVGLTQLHETDGPIAKKNRRLKCALCINYKLPTIFIKTTVFMQILWFYTTFIYYNTSFYDIYCRVMNKFLVWLN